MYVLNEFLTVVCSCTPKYFWKKLLQKFVILIFTLFLAPFAPKSFNYLRHSDSLKFVWKQTNRCHRSKMSSKSEFLRMFKDLPCLEKLTNLDTKGAKRSVKMWTKNSYKIFFKNILYMNVRLSKIPSVRTYVMPQTVYLDWICSFFAGIDFFSPEMQQRQKNLQSRLCLPVFTSKWQALQPF